MPLDPSALILRIDERFGPSPYPGDERIVRHDNGPDLESDRIRELLRGKHWRELSFETLQHLRSCLPFLTAEGYRFYLPAFMVLSIVDFHRADTIPDEVIRSLTAPSPSDVDRVRAFGDEHSGMRPLDEGTWAQMLRAMQDIWRPGGPVEAVFFERASGFAAAQSDIIREFLEYMRDVHGDEFPEHEPEQALERYWSTAPGPPPTRSGT